MKIERPLLAVIASLPYPLAILLLCGSSLFSSAQLPAPFEAFSDGLFPQHPPQGASAWRVEPAFPNLQFIDPIWITQIPGTSNLPSDRGELLLVGKDGQVWRFDHTPAVQQSDVVRVLDWRDRTQIANDMGFYQIVFHPDFGQVGQIGVNDLFACYNHRPGLSGQGIDSSYWRVSRFSWDFGTGTIDPGSEEVLINQYDPQQWHNGGAMFFDNDGFLNITCGDGATAHWWQTENGPMNGGFFGGLFRIDVDYLEKKLLDPQYDASHAIRRQPVDIPSGSQALPAGWPASSTQGYGIPRSNPFRDADGVNNASVLEEFVVYGLRSPHTAHYDPVEDEAWVGDVGARTREELSRIRLGDNAQWPIREGFTGDPEPSGSIGSWRHPFYDYGRSEGGCIIGGMRYRGAKWSSELNDNTVLFGDHNAGKIWAARVGADGSAAAIELLVDGLKTGTKAGLANFCTDDVGEVFIMELNGPGENGGRILRLVRNVPTPDPPTWLSQTGLFDDLVTLDPASGLIPYEVASPLWSDGAGKRRWLAIPNDGTHDTAAEKISFQDVGPWNFPPGSVFVKHFEIDAERGAGPAVIKRLETRVIVTTEDGGKYGVTYKWNAAGTDARLLGSEPQTHPDGMSKAFDVFEEGLPAGQQVWQYPSRADCFQCHQPGSGQALGVKTAQLNRFFTDSSGTTANQLAAFNAAGLFDQPLSPTRLDNLLASRALDDESAPLEHRVRSYLDSNCAHCHHPGGAIDYFDTRLETPIARQGLIDASVRGHYLSSFPGGAAGRYLKPGNVPLSAMHFRANHAGNSDAMPPLGKSLVHQQAVDLLAEYIASLGPTEALATGLPALRYLRLRATSTYNGPAARLAEFTPLDASLQPMEDIAIQAASSEEVVERGSQLGLAVQAIDGKASTYWQTSQEGQIGPPHWLTIDLGRPRWLGGFSMVPRQDGNEGRIQHYEIHGSVDGVQWMPIETGTWPDSPQTQLTLNLPRRPARVDLAGPSAVLGEDTELTIVFDRDVTDFDASDIVVEGGAVTSLRGSGYYYVATVTPSQPTFTAQILGHVAGGPIPSWPRQIGGVFDRWAAFHGLGPVGYTDDPDANGIRSLMEFAFGIEPGNGNPHLFDPLDPEAAGLPNILVMDDGSQPPHLAIHFPVDPGLAADGFRFIGQFSSNLVDWTDVPMAPTSAGAVGWEASLIRDFVPLTSPRARRFGRLKVLAPEP